MAGPRIYERAFLRELGANIDNYIDKKLKFDMSKWIPSNDMLQFPTPNQICSIRKRYKFHKVQFMYERMNIQQSTFKMIK